MTKKGKLKVASSELATRAQTLPPGLNRRRLIVEKSFAAGEAPEDVKSPVYSVLTPKLRQDLLLAFLKKPKAKDLKRIIAFQAIDPGSTTVRHTELYRGSKNSETTLILTDARGQQVFDLHHLVGIQTEDAKSFAEILASWRHRLALDATNVENAFTEVLTQIYCIFGLTFGQVRLGSGCNAFVSQAIIRTETEHSPEITTQLMAMAEPRKLRGHKATATCCISSRDRPGLVVTSGEDGCVCWFDLRCKDVQFTIDVGTEPVSSLCFKTGNEDILYASHGNEIKSFDVHMLSAGSWKPLESYSYNKDEVNQFATK
ncbi:hypothetical protein F2Q68_00020117 [Brassica cretica]|uniref:Uncharacterized protein n=1 Tax=Brassica cretica TaxID=69181 RepID=A0A8S9FYN6_BRACR|nr:hypothetical protein F2Q68_00020117 [Brassica cretica]